MVAEFGSSSFPEILFNAKSGIDMLPESTQASAFISIFLALGLGTTTFLKVILPTLERLSPSLYEIWTKNIWLIGFFFILSGIGHLAFIDTVSNGEVSHETHAFLKDIC
jgi:hypothetical protein